MTALPNPATAGDPPVQPARHLTGLVTIVFTDLVGSTALKQQVGDRTGASLIQQHHGLIRELLRGFQGGEEIETAGDSFLIVFIRPSDAVHFALLLQARLRALNSGAPARLQDRIGIHVGEVVIREQDGSPNPKGLTGIQVDTCARVMSLAQAEQILLTRSAFDSARQMLKGEDIAGVGPLEWLNHGSYLLKGIESSLEVCEVGEVGIAPLQAPAGSEKAQRQVTPESEPVLGWRPAVGQLVPHTRWRLETKLGEGGFGEVWLGRHQHTKERRVFKFCFQADRVRFLKREMTLFRVLKERVGDHPNIVRLHDIMLDHPPFYAEMDYVEGADLRSWAEEHGGIEAIPLETRLEMVAQAADGLQAAHEAGIIHRDIKPANILVQRSSRAGNEADPHGAQPPTVSDGSQPAKDGPGAMWSAAARRSDAAALASRSNDSTGPASAAKEGSPRADSLCPRTPQEEVIVKLTDFGIGQVVSEEFLKGITKAGFTQTILSDSSSSQAGSQMYMAPELLAGKPASIRSDIYSLGVVLYQLLVGDLTRPLTTDWADHISDPLLKDDLKHCFAGNPQNRFAGAGQLAKNLRSLSERHAALVERERSQRRRTTTRMVTVVAVVLLLLAVALGYGLRRAKTETLKARQNLYASDMNLAQQAFEANNLGRAQDLLEQHRPKAGEKDFRDWEWRHLWRLSRSDELFALGTHSNSVSAVAFSPDGSLLATAGHDGTVKLWDWAATNQIATLDHKDAVNSLAFSPDGKTLATGCNDQKVRLWDIATPATPRVTVQFPAKIQTGISGALAFSPNCRILAISESRGVNLWNVTAKSDLAFLPEHIKFQNAMAFSPDGRTLASGGDGKTIRLWDVTARSLIIDLSGHEHWIHTLAFSPNGRTLVSGSWDKTVKVWDVAARREIATLTNHAAWVSAVGFTPDGKTLATASADQTIKLWDTTSWQEITTLKGHLSEVWALACAPNGQTLASGGKDGTVKLWSAISKPRETSRVAFPTNTVDIGVAVSPDGKTFAAVTGEGAVKLWNLSALQEVTNLVNVPDANSIGVSPDGRLLAVGTPDGTVHLLDSVMNREIAKLRGHTNSLRALTFSPDGKLLATGSADQTIRLWDVATSQELTTLPGHTKELIVLTFSRDGSTLASGSFDRTAKLWDIAKRRAIGTLTGHKKSVAAVAFSPDGTRLATGSWDETVKLWDLATQREIKTFATPLFSSFSIVFSKDGRRLVAGGGYGNVKLWDTTTYQEVGTLKGHTDFVTSTIFFDDNTLVTASKNELMVWRAAPFAESDAAEKAKTKQK